MNHFTSYRTGIGRSASIILRDLEAYVDLSASADRTTFLTIAKEIHWGACELADTNLPGSFEDIAELGISIMGLFAYNVAVAGRRLARRSPEQIRAALAHRKTFSATLGKLANSSVLAAEEVETEFDLQPDIPVPSAPRKYRFESDGSIGMAHLNNHTAFYNQIAFYYDPAAEPEPLCEADKANVLRPIFYKVMPVFAELIPTVQP